MTTYLNIKADAATITEGNAGTKYLTFTVTRSGDLAGPTVAPFKIAPSGTNGTVYFGGGETSKQVWVPVVGNVTPGPDLTVTVTLFNVTGATLQTASASAIIKDDDTVVVAPVPVPAPLPAPPTVVPTVKATLDRTRFQAGRLWDFTKAAPTIYHPTKNPGGDFKPNYPFSHDGEMHLVQHTPYVDAWEDWGNDATSRSGGIDQQTFVDPYYNGMNLIAGPLAGIRLITSRNPIPTPAAPKPYVGAMLSTEKTLLQRYGLFEVGVRLPSSGVGAWSAFCLYGTGYNAGDEQDIFEHLSVSPRKLWLTSHLPRVAGYDVPSFVVTDDWSSTVRRIAYEWNPSWLIWYVDGAEVYRLPNPVGGFHTPAYVVLNQAVGGWDGNEQPNPGDFPMYMRVTDLLVSPLA